MPSDAQSPGDDEQQAPSLIDLVLDVLHAHPTGISEYELIQQIKQSGYPAFQDVVFWDRMSLFQTHFLLFHTLYQLKDRLWRERGVTLDIHPLKIMLMQARRNNDNALADHDPLREYYLNLDNLHNTSDDDLQELLVNFWKRLGNQDKRSAALTELGLEDPVDFATIKQQHRRLVMQHHPDRGGSKQKLQAINAAVEILREMHRN